MFIFSLRTKKFTAITFLILASILIENTYVLNFVTRDAFAITAEEILSDPILEKRARNISAKLRCLVCQNQSIDDSDAELAVDLRRQVRDYLKDGMTNNQIFQAIAEKYGEFVLLSPRFQPATYFLWVAPIVILVIGIILIANLFSLSKNNLFKISSRAEVFEELQREKHKQNQTEKKIKHAQSNAIPPLMRIALPVLILILSVGIYASLGRPDLIDHISKDSGNIRVTAEDELLKKQQIALSAFKEAKRRVEKNPDSLSAQFMLAATASQVGSTGDEINALKKALLLSDGDSRIKSQLAETLIRQADGQVTKIASNLISEVLKSDPKDVRALYLHGLELFQRGDLQEAISYWKSTALLILPNSLLADKIRADVKQAAKLAKIKMPNLSFSKIATTGVQKPEDKNALINANNEIFEEKLSQFAKLSQSERNQFIEQMIRRLLENLRQQPDNFNGWLQLAQIYLSTSNSDLAEDAIISASNAVSSDEQRISLIEFALLSHPSSSSTDLAGTQLSMLPIELEKSYSVKFLKGEYARQIGDNKEAVRHWSDILNRIPAETNQARTLQKYINSLENTSYGSSLNQ